MAFRPANIAIHMTRFNTAASCDLLHMYEGIVESEIAEEADEVKHKTFAPSQMRCDRVSWFRLRGTKPDRVPSPDLSNNFIAGIGTACHEIIQSRLSTALGQDWITARNWVDSNPELFHDYDMDITECGYESRISLRHPYPVMFGCDGIVRLNNKVYILEIKTCEDVSDLVSPKSIHIDQALCYSMILGIDSVLFLYQDRHYGKLKCFEISFTRSDHDELRKRMDNVLKLVDANIAPEGLPRGDSQCTSSMCPYYETCKQWGRYTTL